MKDFYKNVYAILKEFAGADPDPLTEGSFIDYCLSPDAQEWRFQGKFGYGGKYIPGNNRFAYYTEDQTPELDSLRDTINAKLKNLEPGNHFQDALIYNIINLFDV